MIPTFNDDRKEMEAIADAISPLFSVKGVTLMPYHTLGASKYKTLGLTYPFDTALRSTEQQLAENRHIFESRKIPIL